MARQRKPVTRIDDWATYPHEFVPVAALALRWGQQDQTIRKWIREGLLKARRFGGSLRVEKSKAIAFEELSKRRSTGNKSANSAIDATRVTG
jgi:hypothetical protein